MNSKANKSHAPVQIRKVNEPMTYVPKVTLNAFTTSAKIRETFSELENSLAFEQVDFKRLNGGTLEAIEHFVSNPVPDVLVIEDSENNNILQLLEELARVLDGETELIIIGQNDSILTYKSLKSIGVFEYILDDVSGHELLSAIQAAAIKTRSGKIGKVVAFVPMSSQTSFDNVFFNFLRVMKRAEDKKYIILDLNFCIGNADLFLHVEENNTLAELFGKRNVEKLDVEQVCRNVFYNLDIASTSNDFSIDINDNLNKLSTIVGFLRELYDHIFILMPLGWQKVHTHILDRSDHAVFVNEDYLSSYRDLVRLLIFLNGTGWTPESSVLAITRNRRDFKGQAVLKEVSETATTLATVIFESLPDITEESELTEKFDLSRKLDEKSIRALGQLGDKLGLETSKTSKVSWSSNLLDIFFR